MREWGSIISAEGETVTIKFDRPLAQKLQDKHSTICEVRFEDGRYISPTQRRKIYATIRDIAEWCGDTPEAIKAYFKWSFCGDKDFEEFSLSDVDMETASEFLTYLIDFCVVNEVPCSESLSDRCEDIDRYIYMCIMHRICAVTGRKADIHHYDRIGIGGRRDEMCQVGMRVIPLCRELHQKIHTEGGEDAFYKKHHIYPIPLTEEMCRVLNLGKIPVS